jgi:hypothetical protein
MCSGSARYRVYALPVFSPHGSYAEAHFAAQCAADESTHAVRLPTRRFHDLGERCAALSAEQANDLGLLAALARSGGGAGAQGLAQ